MNKYVDLSLIIKEKGLNALGKFNFAKELKCIFNDAVLLINIEGIYTTSGKRTHFEGIELLKWLRVNRIYNHCRLYSFIPLHELLQSNPLNAIICSKGTSFVQLPDDIYIDIDLVYNKTANEYELKQLFRMEIDMAKIRHEEANVWGLYKLYSFHNKYTAYENELLSNITQKLDEKLQYAIIKYYNSFTIENFSLIENARIIIPILKKLRKLKPCVVFIDDQADEGWADLLKNIIYGQENQEDIFIVIRPKASDSSKELFEIYLEETRNKRVNLLISDLRYDAKEDTITDYRNLESYKLIKKITLKEKGNYNLRLMYLTAANNLDMYKNLLIENAHRPNKLFVKEGLEMKYDEAQSFEKYKELIDIYDLIKRDKPKKTKDTIQKHDEIDELKADEIISNLTNDWRYKGGNEHFKIQFKEVSDIIIDTNVFLYNKNYYDTFTILLSLKKKLKVHIAVIKELRAIVYRNKKIIESRLAKFYLEFIEKEKIQIIFDKRIDNIDLSKINEEFADSYLIEFSSSFVSYNKFRNLVLFVSNDKKTEKGKEGPYTVLINRQISGLIVQDSKDFIHHAIYGYTNNNQRRNKS